VAERVVGDPRYAAGKNAKPPRKIGSALQLLDCISCDKCVPVCPNDANFAIATPPEELPYEDVELDSDGAVRRAPGGRFAVARPQQWANWADACNECGNCDVFCPEDGGPYVMKARWFGSRASMDAAPHLDGMVVEPAGAGWTALARMGGRPYRLRIEPGATARLTDERLEAEYNPATGRLLGATPLPGARGPHRLSGAVFLTLRALLRGALDPARINPVSASLPGATWPSG